MFSTALHQVQFQNLQRHQQAVWQSRAVCRHSLLVRWLLWEKKNVMSRATVMSFLPAIIWTTRIINTRLISTLSTFMRHSTSISKVSFTSAGYSTQFVRSKQHSKCRTRIIANFTFDNAKFATCDMYHLPTSFFCLAIIHSLFHRPDYRDWYLYRFQRVSRVFWQYIGWRTFSGKFALL